MNLELKVDFPVNKSSSFSIGGEHGFRLKPIIGGDVKLAIGSETLATIAYYEDLTSAFTFEGYEQRAKDHAESVVARIVKAAQNQAADLKDTAEKIQALNEAFNEYETSVRGNL